jgi:phenylalanyl-tRNA synthetase beta chain
VANAQKPSDFFMFKGYVNGIYLDLASKNTKHARNFRCFSEGIALVLTEIVVELGVVKKSIGKHFGIKQEVFFADFNWNLILKLIATQNKIY